MKPSVQIVVHSDTPEDSPVIREVLALDRDGLAPDTLGLRLAEAQDLLAAVQGSLVEQQVQHAITAQAPCPHCGYPARTCR